MYQLLILSSKANAMSLNNNGSIIAQNYLQIVNDKIISLPQTSPKYFFLPPKLKRNNHQPLNHDCQFSADKFRSQDLHFAIASPLFDIHHKSKSVPVKHHSLHSGE